MIGALILLTAAVVIYGAKPLAAWLDRKAAAHVEALVEPVLGPRVDWDAAEEWWAAQGKEQLR